MSRNNYNFAPPEDGHSIMAKTMYAVFNAPLPGVECSPPRDVCLEQHKRQFRMLSYNQQWRWYETAKATFEAWKPK